MLPQIPDNLFLTDFDLSRSLSGLDSRYKMLFLGHRENIITTCCISVLLSVKLKSKKTCQVLIGQHSYGVLNRKEKLLKGRRVLLRSREQKNVLESRALARGDLCPFPCQEKLCRLSGCYCSLHLDFQVHL